MEDSPGVMGGVEPSGDAGNRRVKEQNWTIMFVSEHGRMVHVKHFMRYMIAAAAVLVVSVLVSLICFSLFLNAKMSVGGLEQSLEEARTEIKSLVDRNDHLLARLAVLGAGEPGAGDAPIEKGALHAVPVGGNEYKRLDAGGPESAQGLSAAVVVEGLRVARASGDNTMRIEFGVRKIGDTPETVSGRIFVVLAGKDSRGPRHMVVPDVPMNDGAPADASRGQYFSIARYKAVTMMAPIDNPREFATATVFVFSTGGELLYKTVFPVRVVGDRPSESAPAAGVQSSLTGSGTTSEATGKR